MEAGGNGGHGCRLLIFVDVPPLERRLSNVTDLDAFLAPATGPISTVGICGFNAGLVEDDDPEAKEPRTLALDKGLGCRRCWKHEVDGLVCDAEDRFALLYHLGDRLLLEFEGVDGISAEVVCVCVCVPLCVCRCGEVVCVFRCVSQIVCGWPWWGGGGAANRKWSRDPASPPSAGARVEPAARTAGVLRGSGFHMEETKKRASAIMLSRLRPEGVPSRWGPAGTMGLARACTLPGDRISSSYSWVCVCARARVCCVLVCGYIVCVVCVSLQCVYC